MEYNYEVVKATMDEVPGNIQTAIKIENLETGPGVFVVEQVIRTRSQGTLRRTSTMSLVPGQPKSFYQQFNVDADDVLDLSYRVIAPKKAVLVPTYKYMACGYLP